LIERHGQRSLQRSDRRPLYRRAGADRAPRHQHHTDPTAAIFVWVLKPTPRWQRPRGIRPNLDPAPATIMPVWAFEPQGPTDDVLISSARLWGSELFVEALRVEEDDVPVPVPSVHWRFARWVAAAGTGRP
jgi:hypothetical protein